MIRTFLTCINNGKHAMTKVINLTAQFRAVYYHLDEP